MVNSVVVDPTRFAHIDSDGTTVIRSGASKLHRIVGSGASRIIVYDNNAGSGEVVTDIVLASGDNVSLEYGISLDTGLTFVVSGTSGSGKWTIVYQ